MRNPDLAATYRQIGRDGIGAFYGGTLGQDVVHTVHNLPLAADATIDPPTGLMQNFDLAAYRAMVQAPTHVRYRGLDVYGMAPSSSGGTTIGESLNILNNFDLKDMSTVQGLQHYLEASRLAFADRNRYIGDTRYVDVPKALLSKRFAKQRACLMHAKPSSAREPVEGPNTNHFVVTDKWGNVVSYTNTIEQLGGSAIVVPGRGFLLNNELTDYDFVPLQKGVPDPNLPAPGKRPRSSMSPTIVLKDGKPFLAIGSPGGATIITTVLQILLNRIDFGMSLPQAIAAPRASQLNSTTTQVEPAFLKLPEAQGLKALGQSFTVVDTSGLDPSIKIPPTIGTAAGLEFRSHGTVVAAGEPTRRGGTVAGVVHPLG
jgi:gamma-glutamyltranspeptidase/glutathione hydrolase